MAKIDFNGKNDPKNDSELKKYLNQQLEKIKGENETNLHEQRNSITTLFKIIENLILYPHNQKFRVLKLSNKTL